MREISVPDTFIALVLSLSKDEYAPAVHPSQLML